MGGQVHRSIKAPVRESCNFDERWSGPDKGLIKCWEVGREKRKSAPELAEKADRHELPVMGWKGGIDKELKKKEKYGSFNYLAQWQGLRGENLDIDCTKETVLVCSRTGVAVTFTPDRSKYSNSKM